MADGESEQPSMDSTFSDTDLETINTEELVMFNSIQTFYTNRKDLAVVYTKGNLVENHPLDWIGLFKSGWNTLADYSAYQLVPAVDPAETSTGRRKTVFPEADIKDLFGEFQFMYLTTSSQVLGVSDNFLLSDFDPKSESAFVFNERLAQSFSLISLETVPSSSSSSSENQSVDEETFENIKASSEHTVSNSSSAEFQFVPIYTRRDCWSLSDFVVGNNSGTIREKLCFAETFDPRSLIDEYEPLKQFYLSLRTNQKALVEEVNDASDDTELGSPRKEVVCTDLVLYDKPTPKPLDLRWQASPVPVDVFSFGREYFQHCCLELYRQKLLESESRERKTKTRWILPAPNTLADDVSSRIVQKHVKLAPEVCEVSIPKQLVFSFKKRKSEEKKDVIFVGDSVTEGPRSAVVPSPSGGLSRKKQQQTAKQAANMRKKRSTKISKSKAERGKQEEMLKEAMSLLTSQQTVPLSFSEKTACSDSGGVFKASSLGKSHSGNPMSRKRPIRVSQGVDKAKRRRLNGKKLLPNRDPCRAEDEGYFTTDDEEDGQGSVKIENQSENTMDLLSIALVESLKNNADLRSQTQPQEHGIKDKERISAAAKVNVAESTVQRANKANTSGKAVNTEMKKTCNVALNTAAVAKKDTQSQCHKTKTSGKATNTEKKENRHAASNTASVPKKDTPSQCPKAKTSGASTNTSPAPPKKDAEINTPTVSKTKDAALQSPGPESAKTTKATEPETIKVDVILKSLASTSSDGGPPAFSRPGANTEKWSEVASKRMNRLRRLIAKKREEFARLRENADNWGNKAHALEAQVSSVRSLLSAETIKRINVEKDLQDLRTKFWELLAARKSQPWKMTEPTCCTDGALVKFSRQRPYPAVEPVPDLQPVSFQRLRNCPVELIFNDKDPSASKTTTPDENADDKINTMSTPLPVNIDISQDMSHNITNTAEEACAAISHSESLHYTSKNKEKSTKISEMTVANITVLPDVLSPTNRHEVSTQEESPQLKPPQEEVSSEISEITVTDIVPTSDVLPLVSRSQFKTVPLESTSDYETVPLVSSSSFKNVPDSVKQAKKAATGAISIKRFLMPAMAALSETFCSSKSSCKAGIIVADEHTMTTTTQTLESKPSAKVMVSFSTGIQTSSSSVKSCKKEGKNLKKRGSRSSSRSSKERAKRQEICTVPCQETAPDNDTGESCAIHPSPTNFPLDETKTCPLRFSPSPEEPLPVQESTATADLGESLEENESNSKAKLGNRTTEWYPLTIPLGVSTGDAVAVGNGSATIGIEPVKFHFNQHHRRKSAGKGRSISYADAASGKLTRNLLAAEIVAKAKYQAMEELSREVSAAEAGVIHAHVYEDAQVDAACKSPTPSLPEPSSCSPPPSSASSPPSPPSSQPVSLPVKRVISAFSPPSISNLPSPSSAVIMLRDLAVHQTKRVRDQQQRSNNHNQQQNKQQALPPRPPRALHYDFMKAYSDVISGQIRRGKCLTCGMKFSPAVDRYLVEEHIHFHHAFTE